MYHETKRRVNRPSPRISEAADVLLASSRDGVARHGGQDLVVAEAEFLAVSLADEHVLHMLVVPGAEIGPSLLEAVELVPFEGLDHRCGVRRTGAAHRLQDLHHRRVAEVTA